MTNYSRNRKVYASRGDKHWCNAARLARPSPSGELPQRKRPRWHRSHHKRAPRFRNKTLYCGPKYIVDRAHLRPCAPHNTTSYLIGLKDGAQPVCDAMRWFEDTLFGPTPAQPMYSPTAPHELDDSFERS